eukprot:3008972-Ditylum_brightwellii.AAC.1
MNESVDSDPPIMVQDSVNLIDDDDVSNGDVLMEPVDLDLDTDDDHGVQENDDDSNMISLVLADDIAEPAYKYDSLSFSSDEQSKEDAPHSVSAL